MSQGQQERLNGAELGCIGAGSMGGALLRGLLSAGRVKPQEVIFYDPDPGRQEALKNQGIAAVMNNTEVMRAPVVVLAVKPQILRSVLAEIGGSAEPRHLVISLAAGVPLAVLEEYLPISRVIRTMPNTPLMVQAGMTALSPGTRATPEDVDLALDLFRSVGRAEVIDEIHLDAVTAVSGSGPAFVAVFLEALADGGVKMGLPRSLALEFAAQTVLGTARLLLEKNLHPSLLKDLVASPGGTTIHGLHALEQGAFRTAVINAIEAATWRAQDLAAIVK